jgi:oxygen-independent coproporphyrinogen-3 oxidase
MVPLGLYVHIPFCLQRCPYCAFTVLTGHTTLYERYVAAICAELRGWQHLAPRGPLQTVFVGGGTPSVLAPASLEQILDTAAAMLGIASDAEITLEANPSTAEVTRFEAFRHIGFNRLSLGIQAFNDCDLKTLGRMHSAAEAEHAYTLAREAGFTNLNLDVMFSIPGAPRSRWHQTLQRLVTLQPEHVSTYSLTLEEGTRFAQRAQQGRLQPVSEEDDAWAYGLAMDMLKTAGYEHYEVSNFAQPGLRSRHNWGYWHGAEYLGVGLAAHSYLDGRRHWNTRDVQHYLTCLESDRLPCEGEEVVPAETARRERMWLRLRTCEGVELEAAELSALRGSAKFQGLLTDGLVHVEAHRVRLTPQGFFFADAIGIDLIDILEHNGSAA